MKISNEDSNKQNENAGSFASIASSPTDIDHVEVIAGGKNNGLINPYLVTNRLILGKKFYWSEFLSEQIIRIIAIISVGVILAIFFYVFKESIYAFVNTGVSTNNYANGSHEGVGADESLKPGSYASEPSSDDLKPQALRHENTNEDLKPESYSTNEKASEDLKPTSYSPDNNNAKSKTTNEINELEKGRKTSQSLESAGQNTPVTVSNLILPNDKSDGENKFIWQPISQVPKYSIVPLFVGALKVTLVGLIIAAPTAILAAIFTVAFAPRWIKEIIKPAIEILAGFPSVVIGFFCLMTVATLSKEMFGTTFRLNAFVAGVGMSLAVIPIIYTVTEDALSAVPKSMKEASLALGASKWQTAYRVLLPAAIPGVFAALILGFGRAFGETMIALMATGNAALLSADLFESVRTMSATIGAEMAEVEFHSVHYGVLFLIGSVLFFITFSLNALAELYVRNRLIRKFQGK